MARTGSLKPKVKPTNIAREPKSAEKKPRKKGVYYSEEIVAAILERVAKGEALSRVCDEPDMPNHSTFFDWITDRPGVLEQYNKAIALRADRYAEETIRIADDSSNDTYLDKDGNKVTDTEVVQRSKLRIHARQWYASKIAPKKYGDRIAQELSGPGGAPIQTESKVVLTAEEAYLRAIGKV